MHDRAGRALFREARISLWELEGLERTPVRYDQLAIAPGETQQGLQEGVADLYPAELSGGMQKRVGLARAVAASPEIIFFDEPTTGLDPIMADVINKLIVEQVQELGATGLSITHDMGSVRTIADYVSMIHEGKIVWTGPVEELDNSGNDYVEQFIHGRAEGPITRRVA